MPIIDNANILDNYHNNKRTRVMMRKVLEGTIDLSRLAAMVVDNHNDAVIAQYIRDAVFGSCETVKAVYEAEAMAIVNG